MQQNITHIIKISGISLAALFIVFYAYIQSKTLLQGPSVRILEPANGLATTLKSIEIRGDARNISHISLNDAQIFVDEKGAFKEKLLLNPGYNIVTVKAKDRFGRVDEEQLELVYNDGIPSDNATRPDTATTSASSTTTNRLQ